MSVTASIPAPRGQAFARAIALLGLHGGSLTGAAKTAADRYGYDDAAARLLRAAVAPGTTDDPAWAGPLASDNGAREIFTAIRERSIIGRLAGIRRTQPNTPTVRQTGSASASWVKQTGPKPVSALAYANVPALPVRKVMAMVLATKELLRLSTPSAEDLFREDLLAAVTTAQDLAFIDPANAGVAGERPASITNGVAAIPSTGTPDGDVAALTAAFTGDLASAYYIANPKVAANMSGLTMPNVGARGGEVQGVPLIPSRSSPSTILTLVDPTGLIYFEEGAGMEVSENATLQLSDAPLDGIKPDITVAITSLSNANPAVCTVAAGDIGKFSNGMTVKISGATGAMAPANGNHVISSVGSPANTFTLAGVDTSAGSGPQTVGVSAAVPDTTGAAAVLVSAWQANLAVMRVELFTNWTVARPGSVAFVSGITW